MVLDNLQKLEFKNIMQEHIYKVVEFLLNESQEFGVACEIEYVEFNPPLPDDIQKTLPTITLFMLANYTFESATLADDSLRFEAGFGRENVVGAVVTIPLLAIKQIFVEEYPILVNVAEPIKDEDFDSDELVDSMSILLNNPENAKLLKKRGKRDI